MNMKLAVTATAGALVVLAATTARRPRSTSIVKAPLMPKTPPGLNRCKLDQHSLATADRAYSWAVNDCGRSTADDPRPNPLKATAKPPPMVVDT